MSIRETYFMTKIKLLLTPNTDNMGKLFPEVSGQVVTLFAFAPAPKTNL